MEKYLEPHIVLESSLVELGKGEEKKAVTLDDFILRLKPEIM